MKLTAVRNPAEDAHWRQLQRCRDRYDTGQADKMEITMAWAQVQIEALAGALRMIAEHDEPSVEAFQIFAHEVLTGKPYGINK